jgi:hypothetical protein
MEQAMTDLIVDMIIRDSKVYKNLSADSGFHFASSYMSVDYEGVIKVTEEVEDLIMSLETAAVDGKIRFKTDEFDNSVYSQTMFIKLAKMCGGEFAHTTLCQYLYDASLVQCQMAIAQNHPEFYKKVTESEHIHTIVQSYLRIVS